MIKRAPEEVANELRVIMEAQGTLNMQMPGGETEPDMVVDPMAPQVAEQGEQVAGIGSLGKMLRSVGANRIEQVAQRQQEKALKNAPGLDPEKLVEAQNILQQYVDEPVPQEKLSKDRNININRHHEGAPLGDLSNMPPEQMLQKMQSSDDIARLLEVVGRNDELGAGVQTHESIKAATDDSFKVLSKVATGEQLGLLTPAQLHASRRILTTIGERTTQLANEIAAGNGNKEILLKYSESLEQFRALEGFVSNNVRETARALSQQRMIAASLKSMSGVMMDEALNGAGGTLEQVMAHAKLISQKMADPDADLGTLAKASNSMHRYSVGLVLEHFKASILSGIQTHVVNITSNAALNMYEQAVIMPLAGAVGTARRAMTGANDGVRMGESVARLVGSYAGLRDAFRLFVSDMVTGDTTFGQSKVEQQSRITEALAGVGGRIAGDAGAKVGEIVGIVDTIALRALGAEDDAAKALIMQQEIAALSYRAGVESGLEGDELIAFIDKIATDPPNEMWAEAMSVAQKLTLTNEPDDFTGAMATAAQKFISNAPELGFLLPFVKTPLNLAARAWDMSALGLLDFVPGYEGRLKRMYREGGAQRDKAIAQLTVGVSTSVLVWHLYNEGAFTGGGHPTNFAMRKMHEKLGVKAHGLYFNGDYYSMERLDPFALSIGVVTDLMEDAKYAKTEQEAMDLFLTGAVYLAENMIDSTYARGVNDMLDAFRYKGKRLEKFIAGYLSAMVPLSGMQNTIRKLNDPQPRRADIDEMNTGLVGGIFAHASKNIQGRTTWWNGGSKEQRPARYWDGERVDPGGRFTYAISPVQVGRGRRDNLTEELIKNGLAPREPQPRVTVRWGNRSITISIPELDNGKGELFDRYIKMVGENRRKLVGEVVKSRGYKKSFPGVDSEQRKMLDSALSKAKSMAKNEFIFKVLPKMIRENLADKSQVAKTLGMDPKTFFKEAAEMRLPEEQQEKVKVSNQGDALPLPPHAKESVGINF